MLEEVTSSPASYAHSQPLLISTFVNAVLNELQQFDFRFRFGNKSQELNSLKITNKVETMPAKWITGDVSKLDFDEGLVNEDESNKRLVRMFFIMAFVLLIIANILTIQYSLTG